MLDSKEGGLQKCYKYQVCCLY